MPNDPRKTPIQSRSRETVRAILQAAARILAAEGPDALTTNHIARVAGVGIGSLYQYFPTRDAVVAALVDTRLDEDRVAVGEALVPLVGAPAREQIGGMVRLVMERQAEAAPWLARLLPLLPALDREERAQRMVRESTALVATLLLAHPDTLRPELRDPARLDVALFATSRGLRGLVNAAAMERPELLRDPDFQAAAARMVESALLAA
jgi:AcrR family transcriptional regulator